MKGTVQRLLRAAGLEVRHVRAPDRLRDLAERHDLTAADRAIVHDVLPYTMTSVARVVALIDAVRYVERARIPGDIVECGVWRGGSVMAVARALLDAGVTHRTLWLYDTFDGMTPPTAEDRDAEDRLAFALLAADARDDGVRARASLDEVRANLRSTNYPSDRLRFVPGPVEATIPREAPPSIALLRLDTDWYASTKHELEHLFPRLARGGVLILDDYGHWKGARAAVDEFIVALGEPLYLTTIDYTGRLAIRVGASDL